MLSFREIFSYLLSYLFPWITSLCDWLKNAQHFLDQSENSSTNSFFGVHIFPRLAVAAAAMDLLPVVQCSLDCLCLL